MNTATRTTTTATLPTITRPEPVLRDNAIYLAYDRFVCNQTRCAGSSALYTGRTIRGVRLAKVTGRDVTYYHESGLGDIHCECGRLTATLKNGRLKVS